MNIFRSVCRLPRGKPLYHVNFICWQPKVTSHTTSSQPILVMVQVRDGRRKVFFVVLLVLLEYPGERFWVRQRIGRTKRAAAHLAGSL